MGHEIEVEKIAKLARLKLSEEEIKKFEKDLEEVKEMFDEIDKIEVKENPCFQPVEVKNVTREDKVKKGFSTKEALSNPDLVKRISQLGRTYVDELYKELTPERFMHYSRRFTDHVGLATKRIRTLFKNMDKQEITFTMANFGEVAFTIQYKEKAEEAVKILDSLSEKPVICNVDEHGTILL